MSKDSIGTFTYHKLDDTKIDFAAKWVSSRTRSKLNALTAELTGLPFADPATFAKVDDILALTIHGWSLDKPFAIEAIGEELTRRELAALAFLAPDAIDDIEVAASQKRGGRRWYRDVVSGNDVFGFAEDAPDVG